MQLILPILRRFDRSRAAKRHLYQRSSFVLDSRIVRPEQLQQAALDLISHHLQDIGQVFTLRRQFHGLLCFWCFGQRDSKRQRLLPRDEICGVIGGLSELVFDLLLGGGKGAHGRGSPFQVIERRRSIGLMQFLEPGACLAQFFVDGLACGLGTERSGSSGSTL